MSGGGGRGANGLSFSRPAGAARDLPPATSPDNATNPKPVEHPKPLLFNLAEDIGEKKNLAKEKPDLVERLRQRMTELDAAIGTGARPLWEKP